MKCKVCGNLTYKFMQARLLGKYIVDYFQCEHCRFVQTEEPYWIEEAYTKAINNSDVGLVKRNIDSTILTKAIICAFFRKDAKFVDFGGGYGLFVRMMRDKGFRFYHYDTICENIFAKNFETKLHRNENFELVTAFEVFEHLVQPMQEIEQMLQIADSIFFSTNILPSNLPMPENWWYYGLDHGQHVSIYSYESLNVIARKFNVHLYSNFYNFHLITKKRLSQLAFRFVTSYPVRDVINVLFSRSSLLNEDYKAITNRDLV